ncbi:MAG: cell division protein ZipA [Gammaproteobacteria bacterium]|nr:cell division protein ZipA [Gammaproteobacteria bacterium]
MAICRSVGINADEFDLSANRITIEPIMNELRWILAIAGVLLLVVLYVLSRRSGTAQYDGSADGTAVDNANQAAGNATERDHRVMPGLVSSVSAADAAVDDETRGTQVESAAADTTASSDKTVAEKIISLHLVPRAGASFAGKEFLQALQAEGLQFGQLNIFHRVAENDTGDAAEAVFSVANLVKPGSFDLENIAAQELKGASMFLVLPGPPDPVAAFADMLATGRRLAATLEGQLVDSHGTTVSRQCASHLREELIHYQHGIAASDTTF